MSDFLFSIGADAAQADAAVQEFVKRANAAIGNIQKVQFASNAGAKQAIANQQNLLKLSEQRLAMEEKIAAAQARNAAAAAKAGSSGAVGSNRGGGFTDISAVATKNASAIGRQKDALDFLNRIMGNTIFKFVEYELVMKAFNSAVSEVFNSLNEASNVQMEQVLQRIYNAQINTNQALKDAIIIAKQWGSDITDVQQAIGLWTKQTSQMHDATGRLVDSQTALAAAAKLAADAEKFHRASGIDSLEVYQKSISIWHELGLSLGQIPHLYDQIAFAATKISPVLKAQPGSTSKQEGIKDIFEGMAESGATLRAQGMDDSLIIATVAKQIENLGSTGSKVGTQISTMFGSLNQGGKQLKEWVKILGPDAFKDSESFMDAAISKVDELKQAQADGLLHVKPQTMNTWRTFLETLSQVKDLADQIRGHSKGVLDEIAGAQMNTYNGQVERLRSSFQELNLALGTQLLPTATRFIGFLSGSLLPTLAANSGAVTGFIQMLVGLGGAYLIALGITKVSAAFGAFQAEGNSAALVASEFGAAELSTIPGMEAATAKMIEQQGALARLQSQMAVVEWQTGGLSTACAALGVTETQLAEITATRLPAAFVAAGAALGTFAARAVATLGPLLAIYAAMNALRNFDQMSRINAGVNSLTHGSESGFKRVTDSLGDASQFVVPDTNAAFSLMARIRANGGPQAKQLNDALWTIRNSKDNDAKTDAGELIKQLIQAEFDRLHHRNVPGYDALDQIPKKLQEEMNRLFGGNPAGMTLPGPGSNTGKGPKGATEQQIAAEQTNKEKADAMAEISQWRDKANAAASYAKTIMEVGKSQGFTDEMVKKLAGHLADQKTAIQNGENAAKNEITALQAQQKHLQALIATHGAHLDATGNVHGGGKSSAVYGEAKSWRMAEEAITKAKGALELYEAQKAKLAAQSAQMLGEARAWQGAAAAYTQGNGGMSTVAHTSSLSLGFLGYGVQGTTAGGDNPLSNKSALDSYLKGLDDSLQHTTTTLGKFYQASNQVSTLKELGAEVYALYQNTKDPSELATYAQMLVAINSAGEKAATGLKDSTKASAEFNKNMSDLISKTAATDAEGIGKVLGLSSGDIDAQKTLIDGYNQINDSLTQINTWVTQEAGSYANLNQTQQQMVQNAVNYLNIQRQLLPLLAQQQTIESSIAYQAMQATLQKAGEAQLDQTINRLMGTQSNSKVREQLYNAAKDGQWMSASQSLLKDYLTNTIGDWWKQTVQQMTGTMFGDPAAQARKLEQQMLQDNRTGLQQIINDEKVNVVQKLFQWETKFAQDVAKFTGNSGSNSPGSYAPGNGSNSWGWGTEGPWGNGNSGTSGTGTANQSSRGSEQNPVYVSTYGDSTTGLFSGQISQSNMATAVAAGVDQSDTMQKLADNTDSMSNSASDAASTVQQAATQSGSSGGSSGSAGSAGGLLGALLGPLSSLPGVSKYLSSNGSWLNGLMGAAGSGYGMGTMIGGAGSTNSDFGALGGLVGYGAGMAIGGPAGAQIGGMIGGIFGGLFGHSVNPLDEPDVYDTQNYGQFVSNINGAPGTYNGVTIAPLPQYSLADGEQSMGTQMYQWALKNPNSPIAKQIIALGPKLDIASEYQGEFTLGSGKTISVTAYEQLGQQWQQAAANQQNAPLVSVNSYGGGSAGSAYNTPGMDSSTFLAEEAAWASGQNGTYGGPAAPEQSSGSQGGGGGAGGNYTGGSVGFAAGPGGTVLPPMGPTATPGYGGTGPGANSWGRGVATMSLALQFTTPLYLDGKLITQIVNAYNAQARSNSGYVGHQPYQ